MARIFAMFAVLVLAAGCQTTGETLKKYPVGGTYSGIFSVGKKQVPLPPGEWEIFATTVTHNNNAVPFLATILVNKDPNAKALAIRVNTNTDVSNGLGWVILKACRRTNMLHVYAPDNIEGSDQRCWFINHTRMTRSGNSSNVSTMALERAKEKGVKLPVTSVYAGFRVTDTYDTLTVRVFFNPEAEGFDPPELQTIGIKTEFIQIRRKPLTSNG